MPAGVLGPWWWWLVVEGGGGVNLEVVSVGISISSRMKKLPVESCLVANWLHINIVAVALWESLPYLQNKII